MRPICVTVPNFIKIGQTVAEIWRFNGFFQNGGRPPSWISLVRIGTTHEDYLSNGGLYRCAKFGWNRRSTFDNMKVLIFCAFGLKRLFTPAKLGFWGISLPYREQY